MTGTVRTLPLCRNWTFVPHGSVRWATPTMVFVYLCPHAVPLPKRSPPYQLISGSRFHVFHDRAALGPGLGSLNPALGGFGSLGRLESFERSSRAPAELPGSRG